MLQAKFCLCAALFLLLAPQFAARAQPQREESPELVLQTGHQGSINSMACSPDGRLLAVGAMREVRLYEIKSGTLVRRLTGHDDAVYSVSFSPDGRSVLCGGGKVLIWDVESGRIRRSLNLPTWNFRFTAFWPDGNTAAASGNRGDLQLWDVDTGKVKRTLLMGKIGRPIRYSPDGKTIVGVKITPFKRFRSMSSSRPSITNVALWDADTEREITHWSHEWTARDFAFSPDGSLVAGATSEGVYVRKIPSGELLWRTPGNSLKNVAFSPDGKSVVAGSSRKEARVWDAITGQVLHTLTDDYSHGEIVAVSQDAIITSNSQKMNIWDAKSGALKQSLISLMTPVVAQFIGSSKEIFSMSGQSLLLGNGLGKQQDVNNIEAGFVSFSPDGALAVAKPSSEFVYASEANKHWGGGAYILWNTKTWLPLQKLEGLAGQFSLAWSPDSKTIAASGMTEAVVRIWNVAGWKLKTSVGFFKGAFDLAFSPDGKTLAACIFHKKYIVRLWDVATGRLKAEFRHENALNLAFSLDGKKLATGNQFGTVRLWNCNTGQMLWEKTAHNGAVKQLAFSPDGQILASGGSDGAIQFLEPRSGAMLHALAAHTSDVLSLSFSRDNRLLVSGGADGALHFWDVSQAKLLLTRSVVWTDRETKPAWIAFTPQGYYAGSPGIESLIRWRVGNTMFPSEQYEARFHRPDLVRKAMGDVR